MTRKLAHLGCTHPVIFAIAFFSMIALFHVFIVVTYFYKHQAFSLPLLRLLR